MSSSITQTLVWQCQQQLDRCNTAYCYAGPYVELTQGTCQQCQRTDDRVCINPLKPTVAIWVQLKNPVPDRVKPSFQFLTSGHSDAQGWASECPDVKNYKWRLNPVWHRILYSCTHMATVGFKGLTQLTTGAFSLSSSCYYADTAHAETSKHSSSL